VADVETGAPAVSNDSFIDLAALWRHVWARRWWLLLAAGSGLLVAIVYLNFVTPRYLASLRITPAASASGGVSGTLGRIGNLAAIAGVQVRQSSDGASPFEIYLDRMTSREMAQALAHDDRIMQTIFRRQWDVKLRRWYQPGSPLRPLRNLLYAVTGQPTPVWHAPAGAELQDYLVRELSIVPPRPKDPPITTLVYKNNNPGFAIYLLERLNAQADADIRATSLIRASQYAAHIAQKLATTDNAEHRRALSEALLEQERSIMMANSSAPFAALPTEPATAGNTPVTPKILPTLIIGLLLGLVVGIIVLTIGFLRSPTDMIVDLSVPLP